MVLVLRFSCRLAADGYAVVSHQRGGHLKLLSILKLLPITVWIGCGLFNYVQPLFKTSWNVGLAPSISNTPIDGDFLFQSVTIGIRH